MVTARRELARQQSFAFQRFVLQSDLRAGGRGACDDSLLTETASGMPEILIHCYKITVQNCGTENW
jgi:hypothetical protein